MINQLRRDVRAKHYKPLLLLITLDFLDKQKSFAPIIPAKKILDKINYFSSANKRAITRKQIFNLLKKDQELIGNKILEYYNV